MRRYTTASQTLRIPGIDLTGMDVYVTYKQSLSYSNDPFTLTIDTASVSYSDGTTVIVVSLTQEQTAMFTVGKCDVQVNWVSSSDARGATVPATFTVNTNLLNEVVEYGS